MSITFRNVHVDWSEIYKNKRDWIIVIAVGLPLSMLFNLWLYRVPIFEYSLWVLIVGSILMITVSTVWGFVFGFVGGITSFRTDAVIQYVITLLSAYLVYFFSIQVTRISPLYILTFIPASLISSNLFLGIPIAITIGFPFGYALSGRLDNLLFNTEEKEIEEKNYVNLSTLDGSPLDHEE